MARRMLERIDLGLVVHLISCHSMSGRFSVLSFVSIKAMFKKVVHKEESIKSNTYLPLAEKLQLRSHAAQMKKVHRARLCPYPACLFAHLYAKRHMLLSLQVPHSLNAWPPFVIAYGGTSCCCCRCPATAGCCCDHLFQFCSRFLINDFRICGLWHPK